jgi:putative transcriptional regulator
MKKISAAESMEEALLETANDMYRLGHMSDETYRTIAIRESEKLPPPMTEPLTGADIRALRVKAHLGQAAFARYLNPTVGYVSRLERGGQKPSGPAPVLLNAIEKSGIGAIVDTPRFSRLDNSPPTA